MFALLLALSAGLPEHLPADYLRQTGHTELAEFPEDEARRQRGGRYARAPLVASLRVDGRNIDLIDRDGLHLIFWERHWATLPANKQLKQRYDGDGRPIWDYPIGSESVHEIGLNDEGSSLFELRVTRKVGPNDWAFGSYKPDPSNATRLILQNYAGLPQEHRQVRLQGQNRQLQYSRISLQSCQACHFMNSPGSYQYSGVANAGPCGFVPSHPRISDWARAFALRWGYNPIE